MRGTASITLQQDWAPAHRARSTKAWLQQNELKFWNEDIYPSASPDLNPMDYAVWGMMLQRLHNKNVHSIDHLKAELQRIW